MKFPIEDSNTFKDFYQKVPICVLGFADFECTNEITSDRSNSKTTTILREQVPIGWGLTKVSELEDLLEFSPQYYFGPFCVKEYV